MRGTGFYGTAPMTPKAMVTRERATTLCAVMAVLRLFAAARDTAGTGLVTLPGSTVGDLLERARARFGADFAVVLDRCQVWCNGEPTTLDQPLADDDEVAILPPVSGGCGSADGDRVVSEPPAALRIGILR